MTDICETCVRWSECFGVDADICPYCRQEDHDGLETD